MSSGGAETSGRRLPSSLVVVGAEGFLGSHLLRAACGAGVARVTALCSRPPWRWEVGADPRVAVRILPDPWWRSEREVARAAAGADAVVLLSYTPPPPGADARRHELEINARGAGRLAAAAARAGARVVFASSADVYGGLDASLAREQTVPDPQSPYGAAKAAAERGIRTGPASGSTTVLRIGTVFGPGELGHRAVPRFLRALMRGERPEVRGSGLDVRDYVDAADVAAAFLLAAGHLYPEPVLNVGTGVGRSTLEVLASVAAVLDVPDPLPLFVPAPAPERQVVLDTSRITSALRWRPSQDFCGGLRKEADWLRSHLLDAVPS